MHSNCNVMNGICHSNHFKEETNVASILCLILPGAQPVFTRKLCLGGGGRGGFDLPLTALLTSVGRWMRRSLTERSTRLELICDRAVGSRRSRVNPSPRRGAGDRGGGST